MARTSSTLLAVVFLAACGGGSEAPDAQIFDAPVLQGTMTFAWTVADLNSNALACDDVAAVSVAITATPTIGGFGQSDSFGCGAGQGNTRGLPPGTYRIDWRLGSTVGTLATLMHSETVEIVAGQELDLGSISFEVEAVGGFSFQVDTGASAGNCETQATGGGGLDTLEIQLQDDDGTCIPTTFVVEDPNNAGAGVDDDYVSDCAGAVVDCPAKDVTFTVTGADSGPSKLVFTGYKGVDACYSRLSTFTIPGNSLSSSLINQLLALTRTLACDANAADAGV